MTMKNNLDNFTFCSLALNWWVFGLRGILAIIFGIAALFLPSTTVLALTIVFGAYSLLDGVFDLISGINRAHRGKHWGGLVFSGILGIIIGMIVLILPQLAAIGLAAFLWTMIGFWAITTGIFEIAAALRLRKEIKGEWLLASSGILSLVLGIGALATFWLNPVISIVSLGLLIGAYAFVVGIVLLLLAFKLWKREKSLSLYTEATKPVST